MNNKRVKIAIVSVGIIILVLVGSVFYNRHEVYVSLQAEAKVLGIKEYSDPNLFLKQETLDNFEILINETIIYQKEQLKLIVETSDELEVDVTHIIEDDSLTDVEKYDLVYDEIITYLESEVSNLKNDIDKLLKKDLDYNSDEKSDLDKQKSLYNSLIKEELQANNLIDNYTQNITTLTKIKKNINSINTSTNDRLDKEEAERIAQEEKEAEEARQLAATQSYSNNSSSTSGNSSSTSSTSSSTLPGSDYNPYVGEYAEPRPGCYYDYDDAYWETFNTDDLWFFEQGEKNMGTDDLNIGGTVARGSQYSDDYCGPYFTRYVKIYTSGDNKTIYTYRYDKTLMSIYKDGKVTGVGANI